MKTPLGLIADLQRAFNDSQEERCTPEDDWHDLRPLPTLGGTMHDEWMRSVTGDRLVKFTYLELLDVGAFLTAQIGGHEVVYSVILDNAKHPFCREDVERHFERELRPVLS